MMALVVGLCCGSGCRVLVELIEDDEAADVDGGANAADADPTRVDADVDCASWSYQPAHFDPCALPAPTAGLSLGPGLWTYDTNSGALTDPRFDASFPPSVLVTPADGPEVRIVSASFVDVQSGAILRATGQRPLVIVSWSDLAVAGEIDLSSTLASSGAGANPTACPELALQHGADSPEGAGGGGGGGFGSIGGAGGPGDGGVTAAGAAGAAVPVPDALRGGCPGGRGGNSLAGPGGSGGGALHLAARDAITIDGILNAGGSGGGASSGDRSGGSGAGSGGLIDLQASTVRLGTSAVVACNGGGGGGGSDGGIAIVGSDALADALAALGGAGQGMGAAGGDGAFAQTDALPGATAGRGGGGGGGGTGYIVVRAATFDDGGAMISPPPVVP